MTADDDAGRLDLDAVEAPCLHDAAQIGVDSTDIGDPRKVWRCDACGKVGTEVELTQDRADEYARQLRAAREDVARVRAVAATVLALAVDHGMGECDDGCTDELAKLTAALDGTS